MKQKQATLVRSSQTSFTDRKSGLSDSIRFYHDKADNRLPADRIEYDRILLDILIGNL